MLRMSQPAALTCRHWLRSSSAPPYLPCMCCPLSRPGPPTCPSRGSSPLLSVLPPSFLPQGVGCDVDEYLSRLRRLRWQAMAVRGEEDQPYDSQAVRGCCALGPLVATVICAGRHWWKEGHWASPWPARR